MALVQRWLACAPWDSQPQKSESVSVAHNAPHRASHSRALPKAAGQEHAAHPDLPARRLRLRSIQGQPGRRLPARCVRGACLTQCAPPHALSAQHSQCTCHLWLALGALCCPSRREPERPAWAPSRVASHCLERWCTAQCCLTTDALCALRVATRRHAPLCSCHVSTVHHSLPGGCLTRP